MCGRFTLGVDVDRLIAEFGIDTLTADHHPRFNIAPTQPVLAVVRDGDELRAGSLRWGLVPHWAPRPDAVGTLINARAETAHRKPAFRDAFRHRRCWVLADGFFEWAADPDGRRRPWHFRLPGGRPFAFAGLWDRWEGGDSAIVSCAILTTRPSADVAPYHDRMPVILHRDDRRRWLDSPLEGAAGGDDDGVEGLLAPYSGPLEVVPVSDRVSSTAHDDPECLAPRDVGA